MENENYIMLNGKKIELTDEQIKLIQANKSAKSPFARANKGDVYYLFDIDFDVFNDIEQDDCDNAAMFNVANYCTDENIMKQHALHMLLNNLLWRYSMAHGGDSLDWDDDNGKFYIYHYFAHDNSEFGVDTNHRCPDLGKIYFNDVYTAWDAIKEIVKPFMVAHPEFDPTKM